jgi:MFS family permease
VQGIGSGGLLILVNIVIADLFSMRDRGKYLGMVGMTWAFAASSGPIIGGALTEKVTWRWIFLVNLPTIGATAVVLFLFLDIHTPTTPLVEGLKAIDWVGTVLVIGGTTVFLLGLQFGGISFPWNTATVICLLVFGLVIIGVFVLVEAKVAAWPVIPMRLFEHRSNLAAFVLVFCHGFTSISGNYFLPLYFQVVLGKSPLLSGVYLVPYMLSVAVGAAACGMYTNM